MNKMICKMYSRTDTRVGLLVWVQQHCSGSIEDLHYRGDHHLILYAIDKPSGMEVICTSEETVAIVVLNE